MSKDILDGITKEVEEVEYKGIDLREWLEEEEDVVQRTVSAHEISPQIVKEYDLEDVKYIDITTYDENEEVVHEESRWEMSDESSKARFQIQRPAQATEVTEDIIVSEGIGSDDPKYWVQRMNRGRYRVGVKDGQVGFTYRVTVQFETEANRTKTVHFPVEIIDVTQVV